MADSRVANPLVEQFRKGGVPRELRLMAAQGALPLKPEDLVELLHLLLKDAEEAVRTGAAAMLEARPIEELLPIFRDRATLPEILAWGLEYRSERELREVVLQNTSTPDETIEAMAPRLPEQLAELVVINQVRLLRRTSLLEALESNPDLNNDQRRRLRELRETFRIGGEAEAPAPEVPAEPSPAPEVPAEAAPEEPVVEEPMEAPPISEDQALVQYLSDDERQQTEKISAVQRLYRLNTAEKVITALRGNREERAILIRDSNRLVASAVLGSPRMTDNEVEGFAAMKNISDEILRKIGTHKEWTKKYQVVVNLVKNPRTPIGISLGMVSRLNPRDIKGLATDRNVPEVIRNQALRFVRSKVGGPGAKKH